MTSENLSDSCERGREKKKFRSDGVYWQKYVTHASSKNKTQIESLLVGEKWTFKIDLLLLQARPVRTPCELVRNADSHTLGQAYRIRS